ncbi:MAG TPA: CarD family transcriptional regulator, partial [Candidatus Eremiobacteraceae bacterium]|nr:CarD family transcriptional regulator [Candidatus Eremiobacteraceae bacterium]
MRAARPFFVSQCWRDVGGCFIVWTGTPDEADRFAADCAYYLGDGDTHVHVLRPRDDEPGALSNPAERSARLETIAALVAQTPGIYCVSHEAMRQAVPGATTFLDASLLLRTGEEYEWEALLLALASGGYERVDLVDAVGQFAVRGGLIDVFPATADMPVRLEFFGDRLESARTFSLGDQRSRDTVREVAVAPWIDVPVDAGMCVLDYAPRAVVVVDDEESIGVADSSLVHDRDAATVLEADDQAARADGATDEAVAVDDAAPPPVFALEELVGKTEGRAVINFVPAVGQSRIVRAADVRAVFTAGAATAYGRSIEQFADDVRRSVGEGKTVIVISVGYRRVREVLEDRAVALGEHVVVEEGTIDGGFTLPALGTVVVGDFELFGHAARRRKIRAAKEGVPISEADLRTGEFFVHANHGIGRYMGLEHLAIDGIERDFVLLQYAGPDRLYVPIDQMHLITKYAAADGTTPRLSKMGGSDWTRTRSRVREAVEKIAQGLVRLYAQREIAQRPPFAADSPWQAELEDSFPYDETPDQRSAIAAVKEDMERTHPMDRLVCGDVGYGKTEVAIRAAFKAIM